MVAKQTYCERGEGHAHSPKAIESQGNEDKDGEFCKHQKCYQSVDNQTYCKLKGTGVGFNVDLPFGRWAP